LGADSTSSVLVDMPFVLIVYILISNQVYLASDKFILFIVAFILFFSPPRNVVHPDLSSAGFFFPPWELVFIFQAIDIDKCFLFSQ